MVWYMVEVCEGVRVFHKHAVRSNTGVHMCGAVVLPPSRLLSGMHVPL